ncbi:sugar transporter SWEET1-like [Zerene cesonia]|uniref:sugar transporter SWEET1-like n=1 Tax=Zerene cesonia TaxID=33412 RepID=UPI0018E524A8|nr:sugar transporter SWEET1-like [Zerene cesonia]
METLSNLLQPYKHIVATTAETVTMLQMFSGVFMCWDIYKQKSTKGNDIMPFLFGLIMSVLNLNYGLILKDPSMVQVNFFGLVLNVGYLSVYAKYEQNPAPMWKKIGVACVISAVVIIYTQLENPELVGHRFGIFMMTFMMFMIGQSLYGLKDVIKNKCTEGMPFPIILSGTVVCFSWLLHAIILNNQMLAIQNLLIFALFAFQLSFFFIYPSRKEESIDIKEKKED